MVDDLSVATSLVLTAVLVIATVALAWYTKVMAMAIRQQLDWAIRPVVAPGLEFVGTGSATFRFENVGNGVANDVRVKITSEPGGLECEWAYPSLLPHQNALIVLPAAYQDVKVLVKLDKVHFETHCLDMFGYARPYRQTLEMGPFRQSMSQTRYEETQRELLQTQTGAMKKIAEQLEKLASAKSHP